MNNDHPIVLFDGVCSFCDRAVRFIIDRDPRAVFRFAPLQSDVGRALLTRRGLSADHIESLVLVDGDRHHLASSAALHIARRLQFPWSTLWALIIVPRCIRDLCYTQFARRRYRWFGRHAECVRPTPELRHRFLE